MLKIIKSIVKHKKYVYVSSLLPCAIFFTLITIYENTSKTKSKPEKEIFLRKYDYDRDPHNYINAHQYADLHGISDREMLRMLRAGYFESSCTVNRAWYVHKDDFPNKEFVRISAGEVNLSQTQQNLTKP